MIGDGVHRERGPWSSTRKEGLRPGRAGCHTWARMCSTWASARRCHGHRWGATRRRCAISLDDARMRRIGDVHVGSVASREAGHVIASACPGTGRFPIRARRPCPMGEKQVRALVHLPPTMLSWLARGTSHPHSPCFCSPVPRISSNGNSSRTLLERQHPRGYRTKKKVRAWQCSTLHVRT